MANDLHPSDRDDNIHCPPHADENVNWCFEDNCPGWSRTTFDGHRWRRYGPLDEWARPHLLAHFGLAEPAVAALYRLDRLQKMSPSELRNAANERIRSVKSA